MLSVEEFVGILVLKVILQFLGFLTSFHNVVVPAFPDFPI
jgi:hypothetical protein